MGARTRGLANNVLSSGKLDATDAITGTIAAGNIANASLDNATTYGSVTGGVPAVASDPPSPYSGRGLRCPINVQRNPKSNPASNMRFSKLCRKL